MSITAYVLHETKHKGRACWKLHSAIQVCSKTFSEELANRQSAKQGQEEKKFYVKPPEVAPIGLYLPASSSNIIPNDSYAEQAIQQQLERAKERRVALGVHLPSALEQLLELMLVERLLPVSSSAGIARVLTKLKCATLREDNTWIKASALMVPGESAFVRAPDIQALLVKWPPHERRQVSARLLEVLGPVQHTQRASLQAYDFSQDGSKPQEPTLVLDKHHAWLRLLSLLPHDMKNSSPAKNAEVEASRSITPSCGTDGHAAADSSRWRFGVASTTAGAEVKETAEAGGQMAASSGLASGLASGLPTSAAKQEGGGASRRLYVPGSLARSYLDALGIRGLAKMHGGVHAGGKENEQGASPAGANSRLVHVSPSSGSGNGGAIFGSHSPAPGRVGLPNPGVACSMNSVLQALTAVPELKKALGQPGARLWSKEVRIAPLVSKLMQAMQSGQKVDIQDIGILWEMVTSCMKADTRMQQDAGEVMESIMALLQEECPGLRWSGDGGAAVSVVDAVFGFKMRSTLRCGSCNYITNNFEAYTTIILAVPQAAADGVVRLPELAEEFFKEEQVIDACCPQDCVSGGGFEACGQHACIFQHRQVFGEPPAVLRVLLRRVAHNGGRSGSGSSKNHTVVELGEGTLALPYQRLVEPGGSRPDVQQYKLIAAIYHEGGGPHEGHYYTDACSSPDHKWYRFNDNYVSEVEEPRCGASLYMLLYSRMDTPLVPAAATSYSPRLQAASPDCGGVRTTLPLLAARLRSSTWQPPAVASSPESTKLLSLGMLSSSFEAKKDGLRQQVTQPQPAAGAPRLQARAPSRAACGPASEHWTSCAGRQARMSLIKEQTSAGEAEEDASVALGVADTDNLKDQVSEWRHGRKPVAAAIDDAQTLAATCNDTNSGGRDEAGAAGSKPSAAAGTPPAVRRSTRRQGGGGGTGDGNFQTSGEITVAAKSGSGAAAVITAAACATACPPAGTMADGSADAGGLEKEQDGGKQLFGAASAHRIGGRTARGSGGGTCDGSSCRGRVAAAGTGAAHAPCAAAGAPPAVRRSTRRGPGGGARGGSNSSISSSSGDVVVAAMSGAISTAACAAHCVPTGEGAGGRGNGYKSAPSGCCGREVAGMTASGPTPPACSKPLAVPLHGITKQQNEIAVPESRTAAVSNCQPPPGDTTALFYAVGAMVLRTWSTMMAVEQDPLRCALTTIVLLLGLVMLRGMSKKHLLDEYSAWCLRQVTWIGGQRGLGDFVQWVEQLARDQHLDLGTCIRWSQQDAGHASAKAVDNIRTAVHAINTSLISSGTCVGKGSFNTVYAFCSSDVVRVRSEALQAASPPHTLLEAAYNCAPIVLSHLQAANQRLNDGSAIGILVKALLPMVNKRIIDITQPDAVRGLGAAKNVSIAMVLPRLTTVDSAAKQLGKLARACKAGVWPLLVVLSMLNSVFRSTAGLLKLGVVKPDITSINWCLCRGSLQSTQLTATTNCTTESTKLASNQDMATSIDNEDNYKENEETPEKFMFGNANFLPSMRLIYAGMTTSQMVSFKTALVAVQVLAAVQTPQSQRTFVPKLWKLSDDKDANDFIYHSARGGLGVLYPSDMPAAVLAQVLAMLLHPLIKRRRHEDLAKGSMRVSSLVAVINAREILREKPQQDPTDVDPLAHLCSLPRTDLLQTFLTSGVLERWVECPTDQDNLRPVLELLYEAAHYTWSKCEVNDFLQQLLRLAVHYDALRVANKQARDLLLNKEGLCRNGRSLLHLLAATGNTEGFHTVLQTVYMAGLHRQCAQLMNKTDSNHDTAVMLAAVRGQLEPIMAQIEFVKDKMSGEDGSVWLRWLGKTSELGSLLTILCELYNGLNEQLCNLTAAVPSALQLPENIRIQPLMALLLKLSSTACCASSSCGRLHTTALEVMSAVLELPKAAGASGRAYVAKMLEAKTDPSLGQDSAFHAAAAMGGFLLKLYGLVKQLYGDALADACMVTVNQDGNTPLEVLLDCYPMYVCKPEEIIEQHTKQLLPDSYVPSKWALAGLARAAVDLRSFVHEWSSCRTTENKVADIQAAAERCRKLLMDLSLELQ